MFENLPLNSILLIDNPVENFIEFFKVPKLPKELEISVEG